MSAQIEYAKALFMLSEELGSTEEVLSDVMTSAEVLAENPEYAKLADTPALSVPEKLGLISQAFASLTEPVRNLLMILCEKHSVSLFPAIAREYRSLYNEARGIIPAEAVTAKPLSSEDMDRLRARLEAVTGKTVILKNSIDEELLGGIKLRYSGIQLDGSLKSRLDAIETRLKNAVV